MLKGKTALVTGSTLTMVFLLALMLALAVATCAADAEAHYAAQAAKLEIK